jgi:hypothetical protein
MSALINRVLFAFFLGSIAEFFVVIIYFNVREYRLKRGKV